METALYLAQTGRSVTLISRKKRIASDANPIHYVDGLRKAVYSNPNITVFESTSTERIDAHTVICRNSGSEQQFSCDTVIAAGGMIPLRAEAASFSGCAQQVFFIGDCLDPKNIAQAMRTAFAAAQQL